ncbi:uncharacterized protein LOC122498923 [Leptopilina heterotoma]|uniref:uncharacterized protein LOC122498923 n=1 Tax=Leptopilina heterotoma TaxID=63436 RepID=UPI001CA857F6|nr:uncharacterized protein LOC122498923 [Leptopilina heterotoma]
MDLRSQRALADVLSKGSQSVRDQPINQWTSGLVESRLKLLESYWDNFQGNHVSLLAEIGEDADNDPYFQEDVYHQAENDYVTTRGYLFDIQSRLRVDQSGSEQFSSHSAVISSHTRLPKIIVPPFNGDRQQWESFKDMFWSLIHSDPTLKDVDKLYYLKTLVSGEALSAIHSIPITADNYAIAWSALESRFDNIYLLVQSHLVSLKRMRSIKEESQAELQRLSDDLRRHREQLRSLKRPVEQWDDWFVSIASDCMDRVTRRDWEEELQRLSPENSASFFPSFTQLDAFLQRRCRTLKSLDLTRGKPSSSSSRSSGHSSGSSSRNATVAATTTSKCEACDGLHYIGRCEQFQKMSLVERRKLTKLKR